MDLINEFLQYIDLSATTLMLLVAAAFIAGFIDAIAGGLSWAGCSADPPTRGGSGFFTLAIDIASFIDVAEFKTDISRLSEWIKSSPKVPSVDQIYLPGEIEEARRKEREVNGIEIDEVTWGHILATAEKLNVAAIE